LPIEFDTVFVDALKPIDQVAKEVINGHWGTGATRKAALTTAGYNYTDVQRKVNELLTKKIVVPRKTVDQIAREVIAGKWSSGLVRKLWLIKDGYNPDEVQKRVNQILAPAKPRKSIDQVAKEVIDGKWGSGTARKSALIAAGYDYKLVQTRVNNILK
jgi:Holliday junction resolvasome RuvABC DNA-binding subunit